VGLLDHGRPKAGETVFVSSAAGAVGSLAAQIARLTGCRVVGSVGSDQKAAWLRDTVGLDEVINYRTTGDLSSDIGKCCPEGIDILFEAVGGTDFDTVVGHMRPFGRVVLCGLIGRTNAETRNPGLSNLEAILSQRLTIRGFGVNDHLDRMPAFRADIKNWLADGKVKWMETIVEGIENAPQAFVGLFQGAGFGKTLVRI
jgi:NADPH-dependent curcumin reductase CurA